MYLRAFSTLGCGELTFDQVLALAAGHALDGVELRALAGTIELPEALADRFGVPSAARRRQEEPGILALDTSYRLLDGSAADRMRLLEFVAWAEAMEVPWLRVFDGGQHLDDAALRRASDTLSWWRALRYERLIRADLMVETHDVLLDAARIGRFVDAMRPAGVHILWDAHHTWRRGGEDPVVTWRAIQPHTVHIHVKDSVTTGPRPADFRYVLPGTGEFPMARLRPLLRENFAGTVSLEWERFWQRELVPLDEVLRAAAANRWW